MASTETITNQESLDSQYLSRSLSHLSRSRSTNSLIVRSYKQSTQLYLTKRFKEALETLEPIVHPQQPSQSNGVTDDHTSQVEGSIITAAPVAQSSKTTRTKVWVFYLSLLHSIIDLGPEEGKLIFGSTKWRQLAAKARDGTVWDEIVQAGYGGNEGEVDADVVVNLATLLLGHMPTQKLNQQHLETWLSSSASADGAQQIMFADGTMSPVPNGSSTPSSTPKALASRLKILELYTLHVLPANEEWKYAQEFIEMSDSLDDERRETFLHALQSLKDEKDGTAERERELAEQREREMKERELQEREARMEEARRLAEQRKHEESEKQPTTKAAPELIPPKPTPNQMKPSTATTNGHPKPSHPPSTRPAKPSRKPPPPPRSLYHRASSVLNQLQQVVLQASRNMTGSSISVIRLLMFIFAFLVIVARRDLRLKIKSMLGDGWVKVQRTVGMGVKVSYI